MNSPTPPPLDVRLPALATDKTSLPTHDQVRTMTADAGRPSFPTDWKAVLAAALCGVAVAMNVGKVSIAMPQLRQEFGLSLVAAGWLSSLINTLAVLTGLLFGLVGDRLGAFRMCLSGLILSMAGSLGALFAYSTAGLLTARLAESAGMVAVVVSAPALLSAATNPKDRGFALGIWSAYMPAGIGMVMLLAPLAAHLGGWRAIWILTIAALLAAAASIHVSRTAYRSSLADGESVSVLNTAKEALAYPAAWLLGLAMGCWTAQHFALIIWLPTLLKEQRNFAPLTVSLLSCLMVLVNVPGNLLGGYLLQQGSRRSTLIGVASLVTGLSGAGIFLDFLPDTARYGLCLLLSFSGGLIPASVLSSSAALARTPRHIGTLQGLFMQCGNLGSFIAPPVIAMLVAASGLWRDALIVTGSAALAGTMLSLLIRRFGL